MKKYLIPLSNWRVLVLSLLAMMALVLILGDTDDLTVFMFIKPAGFGLGYLFYRLARHWDARGLISELDVYSENL